MLIDSEPEHEPEHEPEPECRSSQTMTTLGNVSEYSNFKTKPIIEH